MSTLRRSAGNTKMRGKVLWFARSTELILRWSGACWNADSDPSPLYLYLSLVPMLLLLFVLVFLLKFVVMIVLVLVQCMSACPCAYTLYIVHVLGLVLVPCICACPSACTLYPKFCIGFKIRKSRSEQLLLSGSGHSKWFSSAALQGVMWDWVEQ